MKAYTRSVFDVFDGKRRYVIPLFQRQYVWDGDKQWAPLWEDIQEQAENQLAADAERGPHFLGAIVINQLRTYGDAVQAFDVIDGQQRLTTFQLFLAAFRDVAREAGVDRYDEDFRQYTRNSGMMANPDVERHKLWPTQADTAFFVDVMTAGSRAALEAKHPPVLRRKRLEPRHRMVEAYLFFHDSIRAFVEAPGSLPSDRVRALYEALAKRLQIVSIELENNDDPQMIFETLNARGEPLLPSDLLRNFIFLRASTAQEDAQRLYDTYWSVFDLELDDLAGKSNVRFWKVEEGQGRRSRARVDLFLQHYLGMKLREEAPIGHLFQAYRNWVTREKPFASIEAELDDLSKHAAVFRSLLVPDEKTRLGRFAARLRALDTSTVYPLLLWLVDQKVPETQLAGILDDLESYLVRRLVCGWTAKNYNRLFLSVLRELAGRETFTREDFAALLLAQEGVNAWPTDKEFERAWLEQPAYKTLRPGRVSLILRAIDHAMTSRKNEAIAVSGELSVEHVMPQEWEVHWPLAESVDEDEAIEQRERLLHSFGNLTLLTHSLNSTVSNGPYDAKRVQIAEQSALRLNTWFQKAQTWDESAIRSRGASLFEDARKLWQRPARASA